MNKPDLQKTLDVCKWLQSEKVRRDLCGEYEYCAYCENESEYPCALAYLRMKDIEGKKAAASASEAAADVAEDAPQVATQPKPAPTEEPAVPAAKRGGAKKKTPTFAEKLDAASEAQKENFRALERAFRAAGARERITKKYANFRIHRVLTGIVSINRGCMRLQLALDPSDSTYARFPHDDYSAKKCYAEAPFSMKVLSPLSLRRSAELIAAAARSVRND